MPNNKAKSKFTEWLRRYIVAEILGTLVALAFASYTYAQTHSYLSAAAAGFVGEGIGFYGYFVMTELLRQKSQSQGISLLRRIYLVIVRSSANLLVEFAPAEIVDSIVIRPLAMYFVPQVIKPYALGFVVGKFAADILFYVFAIVGYEVKKRWLKN